MVSDGKLQMLWPNGEWNMWLLLMLTLTVRPSPRNSESSRLEQSSLTPLKCSYFRRIRRTTFRVSCTRHSAFAGRDFSRTLPIGIVNHALLPVANPSGSKCLLNHKGVNGHRRTIGLGVFPVRKIIYAFKR